MVFYITLSTKIDVKIMKRYIIEYPNSLDANFFSTIEFFSFNNL